MSENDKEHDLPQINIGDPLYRFLTERLGFRLRHVMSIWILFNLLQTVVIPFFHHKNLQSNLFTNVSVKDIQIWLESFVSQPIVLYVYWTSITVIPNVFKSMHNNRVIRPRNDKTVTQFLHELQSRLTSQSYNFIMLALVLLTLVLFHRLGWSTHRYQGPHGSYPFNDFQQYILLSIHGFLRFTFLAWAIARLLAFSYALRDWWEDFEAAVKPFHADGAGGLSRIGNTTWQYGLILGALGLFLGGPIVVNVQNRLGDLQLGLLIIALVLLLIIVPLAFFVPMWSTHRAMREARRRQLSTAAERLGAHWDELHRGQVVVDERQVEQLSSLVRLHEMALKFLPVWPFGGEVFSRYGLSLAPLWAAILYIAVEVIFPGLLASLFGQFR